MVKKAAVFSCLGLGDGLIALVLSNNLKLNGFEVTTFHPSLSALGRWFPHLPIAPFPPLAALEGFDEIFIIFEKTPWMGEVIRECERRYAAKTHILNPIATKNRNYPYWKVGRFDGRLPFAENLFCFTRDVLELDESTRECGIVRPVGVGNKVHFKRVVIHPTSSRPGKNWPAKKFQKLARCLEREGWDPVFVISLGERKGWERYDAPLFATLDELATFVAESGAMIGNDSGIGHLASALGLPTVTICRNRQTGLFWRPTWSPGEVVFPPDWVPNIKGLRWRDKYWKELISVKAVRETFSSLVDAI